MHLSRCYGAAATDTGADQLVPEMLLEPIRKYHACRAMVPVVRVVAALPAGAEPATVAKVLLVLHWMV